MINLSFMKSQSQTLGLEFIVDLIEDLFVEKDDEDIPTKNLPN